MKLHISSSDIKYSQVAIFEQMLNDHDKYIVQDMFHFNITAIKLYNSIHFSDKLKTWIKYDRI